MLRSALRQVPRVAVRAQHPRFVSQTADPEELRSRILLACEQRKAELDDTFGNEETPSEHVCAWKVLEHGGRKAFVGCARERHAKYGRGSGF